MYYDAPIAQKGIEPSKITDENAKEFISVSARAFRLLADDGNVSLAIWAFPIALNPSMS